MIPFKHADERVWRAMYRLQFERRDTKDYEVVMDHETYYELKTDRFIIDPQFRDEYHLFGLPIRGDSSMRRGEIVLRHGVIA